MSAVTLSRPYPAPSEITTRLKCRVLRLPNNPEILAAVNEVLALLTDPRSWVENGSVDQEEISQVMKEALQVYWGSQLCMIGVIVAYASAYAPDDTLDCDGSTYERADYPALYLRLAPEYIVSETQFTVPDLRGRFPLGTSPEYPEGFAGGEAEVVLGTDEMPLHNHTDSGHLHTTGGTLTGLAVAPGELPVLVPNPLPGSTGLSQANIQPAGGGEPHNNMPPYLSVKYAIIAR